ncbi:hypothetical protein SAY87_010348 [Trapa incisa]|uniref:non-specific serine/threonine protein kinase n=1 Tax=Trapa incisa TaxID=236973 RepID=A0AAN7JAT1_9MYRT|nr:hypothetical protein SAY87_010348 [Trapa incisa]
MSEPAFLNDRLSRRTSIFGLRLWVILGICVGAAIVIVLFLISIYFTSHRNPIASSSKKLNKSRKKNRTSSSSLLTPALPDGTGAAITNPTIPIISKEIQEIRIDDPDPALASESNPLALVLVPSLPEEASPSSQRRIHIEIGKDHRITYPERVGTEAQAAHTGDMVVAPPPPPEVSHLGWGHWYTLREMHIATNGFGEENVIGEGGYGIVYRGILEDNTVVAVKNLLNNRGQAEKEFKVEVEAIGRVRHKNLVRLLGYCVEGAHRILVYEYVDNGNLEQWLHGDAGSCSPMTWDIRMNIITGTAKGLTYLHEGLEPKVVHRDIKSSNILLNKQWNPKVSDFGLAKLLGSERSYVTTRVMGTFGYVAPEYASTGMLNERSDVYSFGILIMEIISGRNPVDYSRPPGEVNLVEWLKTMVTNRNAEGILDPRLFEKPSSRALKRALLVALRCVDPNAQKRPKMGQVVHLLEAEEFPFRDDPRLGRDQGRSYHEALRERLGVSESGDSSGYESSAQSNLSFLRRQKTEEK